MVKNPPTMQKNVVWFLGWEDSLENGMATHSSFLAWRIPWTEDLCHCKESDVTGQLSHTYPHSLTWSDGWMASRTQWSLSELQELVKDRRPSVLQSMGSQRLRHDWATELNWTEVFFWPGSNELSRHISSCFVNCKPFLMNFFPDIQFATFLSASLLFLPGALFHALPHSHFYAYLSFFWKALFKSPKMS